MVVSMTRMKRLCSSAKGLVFWLMSLLDIRCVTRQLSMHSMLGSNGSAATSPPAPACGVLLPLSSGGLHPATGRLVDFSSFLTINA